MSKCKHLFSLETLIFALLYLLSDSTTVPLATAKLCGPCDAFSKRSSKNQVKIEPPEGES